MKVKLGALAIALIVVGLSAEAKEISLETSLPIFKEGTLEIQSTSFPWMTSDEYKSELKIARERSNRKVASTSIDYESLMSSDLKKMRSQILELKTSIQIDPFLQNLEANYERLSPDAKFVAAELVMLKYFKGFVYKLSPLAAKTNLTHSILLSYVLRQTAKMKVYFPTDQAEAFFAYVTEPYDEVVQFHEGEHLQAYLADIVYLATLKSTERIKAISVSTPIVWDNKILYSSVVDDKIDTQDRYTLIGPAEKWAALAAKQMGLHYLASFRAYSVKGVMEMAKELGSLYGVDGFTMSILPNGAVDGVSSAERTKVMNKNKFKEAFILHKDGRSWTERSFAHLKEAVRYFRIAWEEVKDKPANENFLFNPSFFVGFDRQINNHLAVMEDMVQGPTKIRSRLTGETLTVDIKSFYLNPPRDLKKLLPVKHDSSERFQLKKIKLTANSETKQNISFYNYSRGRAIAWDVSAYKPLFPDLKNGEDVGRAARILAQSWGGVVLAGPLREIIQ